MEREKVVSIVSIVRTPFFRKEYFACRLTMLTMLTTHCQLTWGGKQIRRVPLTCPFAADK